MVLGFRGNAGPGFRRGPPEHREVETALDTANTMTQHRQGADAFIAGHHQLLIGGAWVDSQGDGAIDVENPATGRIIGQIPDGTAADVDRAVTAARTALDGAWSRVVPSERARMLWRLSDLLEAHADEVAMIETLDNGKPFQMARNGDVRICIENMRYNSGWATKLNGEQISPSAPNALHAYTMREPIGVVGLIVPWNFPLAMAVAKISPALAAGCTVVLKPAELTSMTALRLGQLIAEAGIPDGVVNIVTGYGHVVGAALTEHPGVDKISFTGSTAVGRTILHTVASDFKRVMLELGGKSPVFVFPDANMETAIPGVARGIFGNTGQACGANSRLYVHRDVFDQVIEGIAAEAQKLRIGDGTEDTTDLGPVISQKQMDRVLGYVDSGRAEGASVVTGGGRRGDSGYFVEPTVLVETKTGMRVVQEEIFGPVLCAMPFDSDDIDTVAAEANTTEYGLSAAVWTQDVTVAHSMARKIKSGMVRINGGGVDHALPYGGFKASGWGREYGREGVEAYTELKTVVMAK